MNAILDWIDVARLGYRGANDALPWYGIVATAVLGPLFYILFFYFVRLGAVPAEDAPRLFLSALLLLPVSASVFGTATVFGRLRSWGVLQQVTVSRMGLFSFGLAQTLLATALSALVNLAVVVPLGLAVLGNEPLMLLSFWAASIVASFALGMMGLACAMAILTLRDHLMVINALFFVVILSSGVLDDLEGPADYVLQVNPLRPLVSWINDPQFDGTPDGRFMLSILAAVAYLAIARAAEAIQMRRIRIADI